MRKKINTVFLSLVFLCVLFSFYLGWSLSDRSLAESELIIEKNLLDMRSFSQGVFFQKKFGDDTCDKTLFDFMSKRISETGLELEALEREGNIDSSSYSLLKQRHNMNQAHFYTYYKQLRDTCELDTSIVLFFFNASEPELAEKQGEELSSLLEGGYDIRILPMDYGYTTSLEYFYSFYEITELPSIVLDFEYIYEGVTSSDELEDFFLSRETNLSS